MTDVNIKVEKVKTMIEKKERILLDMLNHQ